KSVDEVMGLLELVVPVEDAAVPAAAAEVDIPGDEAPQVSVPIIATSVEQPGDHDAVLAALRTLAAWASTEHGARSLPEAMRLLLDEHDLPFPVAQASRVLLGADLGTFAGRECDQYDVHRAFER